jgi:primosomal protein N' (replication factor Y) (superfamily II helicase)
MKPPILRIAVGTPLYRCFDYLAPVDCDRAALLAGQRVRVPFGRRTTVGLLLEVVDHTDIATARLKRALEVLDTQPVIAPDIQALVNWASRYYQYPVGEAYAAAMPALLRQGQAAAIQQTPAWRLTAAGRALAPETLVRAPRQAAIIAALQAAPQGIDRAALDAPASVLHALTDKGWIETFPAGDVLSASTVTESPHTLNPDQQRAVDAVALQLGEFASFLLEGVTGSGKTEVYLHLIDRVLARGQQVLVLVPEIGLTPQLVSRFHQRFPVALAVLHSGLTDRDRLNAWLAARAGSAPIVLGTRSAIFTPLARPGLVIVDEEHDASLKQQEGFRYSARDLAVWRARRLKVPVVLGSATPSLESLYNVEQKRYQHLVLPERTGRAELPVFRLIDVRQQPVQDGLTPLLLKEVERHLAADGQVLLFLNRRGFAPTLMCYGCDWVAECRRCDARLTWHHSDGRLHCHHCGSQRPVDTRCPQCGGHELHPQGQGTERVEQALAERFPDVEMLRIDRDTTRRKGALDRLLAQARDGQRQILLGTQMLAKGHHFPNVTLVGILDADQGLFSTDFRASERMAQLIVQVAGRAGRQDRPGQVVIQTAHPGHPLLATLVTQGYPAFAAAALEERKAAHLPPLTNLALLRAEATDAGAPVRFLEGVRERIRRAGSPGVEAWGPVPAGMERRAGRYRAQLLLQSDQRAGLQQLLDGLVRELEQSPETRRVRWSVDVDPADTY